ncbi:MULTISPECIES: hypothetical protein [Cyanophyceae]|uniref:hypothetical protein n=1 Tax=Cyanophyceae TaxID=3028117 RepID=UPI00016DCEB8|nr:MULTISPECIES: hypothetical protein [Cyanophyceae]ACB00647.1 conserved hypothetical protein [Picosynechococcus sp. PCC 7002]AMA10218.1 hypothetical protein AWQ23_13305 [Picosynechococcus sp. PCC 73109]ANV88389.1 hypothetical protein AWQ22_13475 [Picosynechococcus sp. PCC 7117]ANV91575.1 hypothetical protein AWQ24_13565 [Picosynechococcus sp. PCC 8807]QCS48493.1 hypothetical protein FEK30_03025 [Picosynechococcus sp. PCC 11901]
MTLSPVPGNYFTPRTYIQCQPETGLLKTRHGNRLLAVPEVLLRSIHKALREETGEATPFALYTFGFWWGGAFYDRLKTEIEAYYQRTIPQMNALEFLVMMRQIWETHGFGHLNLDFTHRDLGLIKVQVEASMMQLGTEIGLKPEQTPSYHLEAGFIAAWFSRWAGKGIRACAVDLPKDAATLMANPPQFANFLVGLGPKIEQTEMWVKQGLSSAEIIEKFAVTDA